MFPKVSVVIPVYNVAPFLRECLDSVLQQTLTDIEIICGDGGSTDGSLEILQEYARLDSRIRIVSKEGSGYGQSMNDCMALARGEYIGIVESDDAIKADMYEILYERAVRDNLDWVRGDIYLYYSNTCDNRVLHYEKIIIGNFYDKVLNPQSDVRPWRSRLRTWSGIYKREFLQENSIKHNETSGGSYQDIGFYLKTLYFARRVEFIPRGFYMWRQDNSSSSIHYDSAQIVDKIVREWKLEQEYLNNNIKAGTWELMGFQYRKFLSYMWAIDQSNGKFKEEMRTIAFGEISHSFQEGESERSFFRINEWHQYRIFIAKKRTPKECCVILQKIKHGLKSITYIVRKNNECCKR